MEIKWVCFACIFSVGLRVLLCLWFYVLFVWFFILYFVIRIYLCAAVFFHCPNAYLDMCMRMWLVMCVFLVECKIQRQINRKQRNGENEGTYAYCTQQISFNNSSITRISKLYQITIHLSLFTTLLYNPFLNASLLWYLPNNGLH